MTITITATNLSFTLLAVALFINLALGWTFGRYVYLASNKFWYSVGMGLRVGIRNPFSLLLYLAVMAMQVGVYLT